MAKFNFMDIMNLHADEETAQSQGYQEIFLDPREVKASESNFYSQDGIEELADSFLTVGQQQPTVLALIENEYIIVSGHRRNRANTLNLERGHTEFTKVKFLYKKMSRTMLELNLIVGNIFNRGKLTQYEETEQAVRFKKALVKAREEGIIEIQGSIRKFIADALQTNETKLALIDKIDSNLIRDGKEEFKKENIGLTAAYEISKLEEGEQAEIIGKLKAGEDIRAKDISEKLIEKKLEDATRRAEEAAKKAEESNKKSQRMATAAAQATVQAERAAENADYSVQNIKSNLSDSDNETSSKNALYKAFLERRIIEMPYPKTKVLFNTTYLCEEDEKSTYSIEKCRLVGYIHRKDSNYYVLQTETDEIELNEEEMENTVFPTEMEANRKIQHMKGEIKGV